MSNQISRVLDTLDQRKTGQAVPLATDGYGKLYTVGGGTTQILSKDGYNWTFVASSDGYAGEVAEQFSSTAEDNTNGVLACVIKPIANSSYSLSYVASTADGYSLVCKASPGKLYKVSGYLNVKDTNSTQYWIQLHNAVSLPANAAVPFYVRPLGVRATAGPIDIDVCFADLGIYMNTGIVACISTTGPTLTISTLYTAWFNLSFI